MSAGKDSDHPQPPPPWTSPQPCLPRHFWRIAKRLLEDDFSMTCQFSDDAAHGILPTTTSFHQNLPDFFSRIRNYWVETWNFWMSSSLGERTLQKNHSKRGSFGISPCLCLPQLLFGVVFQHRTMNHTPHKIGEVLTQPNRRFKQKLLEIGDGRYFRLFLMKLFWQVWNMRGTWRCFWSSSFGTVSDGFWWSLSLSKSPGFRCSAFSDIGNTTAGSGFTEASLTLATCV